LDIDRSNDLFTGLPPTSITLIDALTEADEPCAAWIGVEDALTYNVGL
jgi:hypothetical protein